MSEEPTTHDLVALTRELGQAQGVDATLEFYRVDAVYDMSRVGLGTFQGRAAISRFLGDWLASYDETEDELQEVVDLGNGVVCAAVREAARPSGSPAHTWVHAHFGMVFEWTQGKLACVTAYTDLYEARATAERLAQQRGQAMSGESTTHDLAELVRGMLLSADRGDFDPILQLYARDAAWVVTPADLELEGVDAIRGFWEEWYAGYEDFRVDLCEIVDLGGGVVLALTHQGGRPAGASALLREDLALVYEWSQGLVVRVTASSDVAKARAHAVRLARERG
jgi:ketosteroid isomerase-like protein